MAHTFSLAALTVIELTPPEIVSTAANAGYEHVGLRLIPATPEDRQYPVIGDTPMVRDILSRLSDLNISVLDVEVFRLKPETQVRDFKPAMETAARLGARHLLVTGQDADAQRLADNFAALCDLAAPLTLTANLEYMPWTEISSLAQSLQLLAAANRPNSGVLLDPLHVDRCRTPLAEVRETPRKWLHYLQLCDAPAERPTDLAGLLHQARSERLAPGEGGLKLRDLLQAVPRDLPISLEVASASAAKTVRAVDRARRILAAAKTLLGTLHTL